MAVPRQSTGLSACASRQHAAGPQVTTVRPNPSLEPTRTGMALGPRGAWFLSSASRAKRHTGARGSAQTLGLTTSHRSSRLAFESPSSDCRSPAMRLTAHRSQLMASGRRCAASKTARLACGLLAISSEACSASIELSASRCRTDGPRNSLRKAKRSRVVTPSGVPEVCEQIIQTPAADSRRRSCLQRSMAAATDASLTAAATTQSHWLPRPPSTAAGGRASHVSLALWPGARSAA